MGARGPTGLGFLALLLALSAASPFADPAGAQGSRDRVLPGCGICYPGGYDINTVGEVKGTILDLQVPADGPVRFVVADERERWVVLASPARFWESAAPQLVAGDSVSVRGSKTLGADGTLYVVAGEVRALVTGNTVVLRDPGGFPVWRGGSDAASGGGGGDVRCRQQGRGRGTDRRRR